MWVGTFLIALLAQHPLITLFVRFEIGTLNGLRKNKEGLFLSFFQGSPGASVGAFFSKKGYVAADCVQCSCFPGLCPAAPCASGK